MRVNQSVVISSPQTVVWDYVSDLDRYLDFLSGITRWEVDGTQRSGLGARRRMLIQVRSAEVGGMIEVVEWDEPNDLAWTSVTGVDQRGRIRLRPAGPTATRVELRYQYGVAGAGISGWISEHVAAPTISTHLETSLRQLKTLVETSQQPAAR
jgi:uncharacterized membrane protein